MSREFNYIEFLEQVKEKAKELMKKKEELEEEFRQFYVNIVKTLVDSGLDNIIAVGLLEGPPEDSCLESGIILKNGIPYYYESRGSIEIPLEDEDDISIAVDNVFRDLLLLISPKHVIDILEKQYMLLREGKNVLKELVYRKRGEYPDII